MIKYDAAKIQELFERHSITDFNVKDVYENENGVLIYVKQKRTLASYLQNKCVTYLKFKNSNVIYEAQSFYINIEGTVKIVYVIKKGKSIVYVLSLYEINNHEKFNNSYLNLVIDEIIEEV